MIRAALSSVLSAFVFALVLVAPVAHAWGPFGIQGNGSKVVQPRSVGAFTRIEIKGSVDAVIHEGPLAVAVNIDSNLQPYVLTELRGDTLVISTRESIQYRGIGRAEIAMPELQGVLIRGSGDVTVERMSGRAPLELRTEGSGDIRFEGAPAALDLGIAGSGDMKLVLDGPVDAVRCDIHGSGDVALTGKTAGSLAVTISGSGGFDSKGLTSRSGRFQVNGSGDIRATLDGGDVEFATHGSGDIDWWGQANVVRSQSAGSGEIQHHSGG